MNKEMNPGSGVRHDPFDQEAESQRMRESRRRFLGGVTAGAVGAAAVATGAAAAPERFIKARPRPLALATVELLGVAKGVASRTIPNPPFAYVMLSRMGFGPSPRPGQTVGHFNSLGANNEERLANYLAEQLDQPEPDTELDNRISHPAYQTLNKNLTRTWADHEAADGLSYSQRVRPAEEAEMAKFLRASYSRYQLREKLAEFWNDHFNMYSRDNYSEHTMNHWDRSVIRGNMLGNFRTMVGETAKHPAMLWYLDNYNNTRSEPNENYARELFELHTVGVENYKGLTRQRDVALVTLDHPDEQGAPFFGAVAEGYTDDDVYEAGACFTGWRVRDDSRNEDIGDTGEFYFDESSHERTGKSVLSGGVINIDPDGGLSDGESVLDMVCYHPGTARHIAGKLARFFISDDIGPDDPIVLDVADVFYRKRYAANQLRQVVEALIMHPQFQDTSTFPGKVRRPFDLAAFAMRTGKADFHIRPDHSESESFKWRMQRTGQYPFRWRPPDGYPHESEFWLNSVALVQTWRAIDWLCNEDEGRDGPRLIPILDQTFNAFSDQRRNHTPVQLVDFWMRRIFGYAPGGTWEGDRVFERVLDFFISPYETGVPPWPRDFAIGTDGQPGIDSNSGPWDWNYRLRAMVAMILCSPYAMQK